MCTTPLERESGLRAVAAAACHGRHTMSMEGISAFGSHVSGQCKMKSKNIERSFPCWMETPSKVFRMFLLELKS